MGLLFVNGGLAIEFAFGNVKRTMQSAYHTPIEGSERGREGFYYIFFVMLHEWLKVRTKAKDEDVDKMDTYIGT